MLGGELHEYLLDEIRFGFGDFLCEQPEYADVERGVIVESSLFNEIFDTVGCRRVADAYLLLSDGAGPVAVEIGNMKDGKWQLFVCSEDKKPVRVLRVGFDGSVWLLNPRNTSIEASLLNWYRARLEEAVAEYKQAPSDNGLLSIGG